MKKTPPRYRLCVLISSLTIGGAEQLLLAFLKAVDRSRFDITVLFLRDAGILGAEILRLDLHVQTQIIRSRFDLRGVFRVADILARRKIDILLLINHLNTLFFGVTAAKMARVPVCVNWENETFKRYPFHGLTMFGRRILHLGIDAVVAAARGHKAYIAQAEHVPAAKIHCIYNGVDPRRFASRLSPQTARKRLSIPAQSQVVSIIAVLRPDKAHEIFLEAARMVLRRVPQTHFIIIGDGPRKKHLMLLCRRLGLEEYVHFLGFQRELADILAAVDINTLSSKPEQETLSVAAIEAMSTGIPMVCTDVGFMKEIVIPQETGFLVPVGDPEALAQKLILLLENRSLLARMRINAKDLVLEKLTVTHMARAFEQLFIKIYQQNISTKNA